MPVMQSRVTCLCERKSEKRPRKEAEVFQVEVPSLCLAYRFQQRSHPNQCVLISCIEWNLSSRRRRSLPVFSEKLVVHAYHRKGFSRLEAIDTNGNQNLLNVKCYVAEPPTSRLAQQTLRDIIDFSKIHNYEVRTHFDVLITDGSLRGSEEKQFLMKTADCGQNIKRRMCEAEIWEQPFIHGQPKVTVSKIKCE